MKTQRLPALLVAALAVGGPAGATELSMNAGELAHTLDRLAHTTRVLYVAAHPDDENTRLLAYLANARHATVERRGDVAFPIDVQATYTDGRVETQRWDGASETFEVTAPDADPHIPSVTSV